MDFINNYIEFVDGYQWIGFERTLLFRNKIPAISIPTSRTHTHTHTHTHTYSHTHTYTHTHTRTNKHTHSHLCSYK